MEKLFTTGSTASSTNAALELMATLAVLIVAALLFAGYGLREGRAQMMAEPGFEASTQDKADRMAALRRLTPERNSAGVRSPRATPTPLLDRF